MLPPEIGSGAPALLTIDPTADIMGLPLREARDLFETQYLQAQLMRFGGNISPDCAVRRHGAQRAAPEAEAVGGEFGREGGRLGGAPAARSGPCSNATRWQSPLPAFGGLQRFPPTSRILYTIRRPIQR